MEDMLGFVRSVKAIDRARAQPIAEALHKEFASRDQLENAQVSLIDQVPGITLGEKNALHNASSKMGHIYSAVGIIPFHRVAEGDRTATVWIRQATAKQIRRQLDVMGVIGIVDIVQLSAWVDLPQDAESVAEIPVSVPDEVEFEENQVYYIVWSPSPTYDKVRLLENWRQHVQRGLQVASSRYARLRLAQAGEQDVRSFDAFKINAPNAALRLECDGGACSSNKAIIVESKNVLHPDDILQVDTMKAKLEHHIRAGHPAVRHLRGKRISYAIAARDKTSNPESARDMEQIAREKGYELWEPSGKEFNVAEYSVVLPSIPRLALEGVRAILASELSPRSFGIMMY